MAERMVFFNGVYRSVLEEILRAQLVCSHTNHFLQPYSGSPIGMLQKDPPTRGNPVTLCASTTDDLRRVSFQAEIVGWEDKTALSESRRTEVVEILNTSQEKEGEGKDSPLYNLAPSGERSVNLLSVVRLVELVEPFSVSRLIKVSDGKPLSANRSRSGGWSQVRKPEA